jgi:hypothetical protein
MPRLSARTIAIVKQNVSEMLTDSCTIKRESGATGMMGEPLHDLVLVASGVACRVIRSSQRLGSSAMQVVGSQEAMVEVYRLICPVGTSFLVDDVVTLADGSVYQVVNVEDQLTDEAFAGAVISRVRT